MNDKIVTQFHYFIINSKMLRFYKPFFAFWWNTTQNTLPLKFICYSEAEFVPGRQIKSLFLFIWQYSENGVAFRNHSKVTYVILVYIFE